MTQEELEKLIENGLKPTRKISIYAYDIDGQEVMTTEFAGATSFEALAMLYLLKAAIKEKMAQEAMLKKMSTLNEALGRMKEDLVAEQLVKQSSAQA